VVLRLDHLTCYGDPLVNLRARPCCPPQLRIKPSMFCAESPQLPGTLTMGTPTRPTRQDLDDGHPASKPGTPD
jgi:hypothetical protein